jgi:hypothetical protein
LIKTEEPRVTVTSASSAARALEAALQPDGPERTDVSAKSEAGMALVGVKKLEDCLGGGMLYEYRFDRGVGEALMHRMASGGRLDYHPEFLLPFYKIITRDGLQVKGILGETSLEVVYPETDRDRKKEAFERILQEGEGRARGENG